MVSIPERNLVLPRRDRLSPTAICPSRLPSGVALVQDALVYIQRHVMDSVMEDAIADPANAEVGAERDGEMECDSSPSSSESAAKSSRRKRKRETDLPSPEIPPPPPLKTLPPMTERERALKIEEYEERVQEIQQHVFEKYFSGAVSPFTAEQYTIERVQSKDKEYVIRESEFSPLEAFTVCPCDRNQYFDIFTDLYNVTENGSHAIKDAAESTSSV